MKKKIFSLLMAVFLMVSCFSWSSLSANSQWAVIPADFSSNRQNAVDNIRSSLNSGNTPQSAITTAQNKLVENYNNNRSSGIKTEYWLVVLSDGEFNEQGVFGKAGLDMALQNFSKAQIADGMDLHTIYLAIGSNAIEAASEPALNIISRKCDNGIAIVLVLSELSNDISGRYRISKDFITLVDSQDIPAVTVTPTNPNNPSDKTVYKIIVVPEGFTVDRDDLPNSIAAIRFVFTGDGLLLTKEESKGLPFQISLDRNIPYTLQQEDDGSYSFRPKAQWPPLFYPTGKFTVTGTLNNTITNSTVFEITSLHLFKDTITLIWPLFILAYLVFYLTKKRFVRAYITRKIYFIADAAIHEGSKSQVFVKPSTGWRQFLKHACTQKFAYLNFVAARNQEVSVKYLLNKPIDYLVASLSDNLEEIEKIFTSEFWKTDTKLNKNIRVSESTALYIRTKNNISVYYIRKWKKRASKRSKSSAASSNNDDDVMYMYEQGDSTIAYNSIAELKKDAAGIVTGAVISVKPIFRSNILHTLTEVSVEAVYSGPFSKGDVIYIEEQGGQVTMQDYIRGTDLENEAVEEITTATEKTSVVVGIDGYYPIPLGRHVLLFLKNSGWQTEDTKQEIYSGLGGYLGIFYQQSDKYTYVNPKPDASGIHASLEALCANGGRMSVTAGELYKKEQ